MSVHRSNHHQPGTFFTVPKYARDILKGGAFRVYCYLVDLPNGAEISPAKIAKSAGIGKGTIMRAFREMKAEGFMAFEEADGHIERSLDSRGVIRRKTTYEFYETPEINPFQNRTRLKVEPVPKWNREPVPKWNREPVPKWNREPVPKWNRLLI